MKQQCEEIEELQRKHDTHNLHKKIKQLTNNNRRSHNSLVDTKGKIINNDEERISTWEKYITDIFADERNPINTNHICDTGPPILKSEIQHAINNLKNNKTPGPDCIHSELLKLINDDNIGYLTTLFNKIYNTGEFPQEWLKSTFIPIPKKANARTCNEYRLISLMSQVLKILLKIIHNRIYMKCEATIGMEQFGFRNGLGTREALFSLQILAQKCYDQQKDLHICFIDFEKAFDRVKHEKLFNTLGNVGIDDKDIRLLKNLYWHQIANIKIDNNISKNIEICKGVRQGCVLSPTMFNIYSECLFNEALNNCTDGIKVNGVNISTIRYADDTVLLADSDVGLQRLMDNINAACEEYGMSINIKKTKVMIISRNQNVSIPISINGEILNNVYQFKYLGCIINAKLDTETEIKARIEQARGNFIRMRNILCDQHLDLELRCRLSKCYVWSTLMYGAETWTLKVSSMNRLEAFEMWTYRRILKIPYTAHITNEEVLRRVNKERDLLHTVKCKKTSYLGHILRNDKYYILQLIIKGKIEGKRSIGRKKLSWLRNIRNWTGLNFEELIRTAENREQFEMVIANLR